jgi:hypothetical protein
LPVRPGCVTRSSRTQSTCCVCGVRGRLPVSRCRKSSCSTPRWHQFVPDAAGTISCGLSERARLR